MVEEQKEQKPSIPMTAEQLMTAFQAVLQNAQNPSWKDALSLEKTVIKKEDSNITKLSSETEMKRKTLKEFKTGTFIDEMFLDYNEKPIHGLPFGSNTILTGVPNTGKSLLVQEIVLRIAGEGRKVCFVTSEEIFRTETARYDLENRMMEKAKLMNLDWKVISQNLFVFDAVSHANLREWEQFVVSFASLVENEKIEFVAIDSLTLLEDVRGQLKVRLLDLMRYGQIHGLTTILISQRSGEDPDSIGSIAGGISLSHIADIVMELDSKKVSSWDSQIKLDIPTAKQGTEVNFFKILKNRLTKYNGRFIGYQITSDGFVKPNPKV